jgi:hypothetical protein
LNYRQFNQTAMYPPYPTYSQDFPQPGSAQKYVDPEYTRLENEIKRMEKDMDRMNRRILLIELQLNNMTPAGLVPPIMELPTMAKMDAMEKLGAANYKSNMPGMNPFGIGGQQNPGC